MDGFRRRAKNKFGHSGWIMEFDAVSKKQYIFNHLSQSLSSSPPPGAATAAAGAAAAPSAAAPDAAVRPAKRKQNPRLTLPLTKNRPRTCAKAHAWTLVVIDLNDMPFDYKTNF